MTVVFPLPLGAKEAEDFALLDAEADIVDGCEVAEAAHEMLGGDGKLLRSFAESRPRLSTSRFQFHIRGHSGKDAASRIIDANLYGQTPGAHVPRGFAHCAAGIQLAD